MSTAAGKFLLVWLDRIGKFVLTTWLPVLALAVFLLTVAVDGLGRSPGFGRFLQMAQHPGSDPGITGTDSFVLGSPGSSLLAALVGVDTPTAFMVFHFVLVVGSFLGIIWAAHRRGGARSARVAVLLWAALPVSTVLLTWLGQPDPLIVAAGTALAVVNAPVVALVWSLVGGFTHSLQMVLIVGAVTVIRSCSWRWVLAASVGVVAGSLGVEAWHRIADISQELDRLEYMAEFGPLTILGHALRAWLPVLWSLFAGVWPVVIWLIWRNRRTSTVIVLVVLTVVAVFTFDTTRVFALLSWPIVFLLGFEIDDDRAMGWLAIAAVAVPPVVVWAGNVLGRATLG